MLYGRKYVNRNNLLWTDIVYFIYGVLNKIIILKRKINIHLPIKK